MVQQDPEAEVRTVAAHHVANFSKHVPQEVITDQVRVRATPLRVAICWSSV